jgi:2-polyprenyl-6-methoxyphenol hydroxylase-like FAD-dependent oxidoreductase
MHNLMTCGQVHIEALLPGFCEQLRAAGGREVAVASGTHVFEFGTTMPSRDLGLRLVCAPRPLIEHVARRLLLDRGGVSIRQGVRARQLLRESNGSVAGVLLSSGSQRERVSASLVVDASGVRAEGRRWLQRAELPVPRVDRKRTSRWYVTGEVRRPASQLAVDQSWMIFPTPPQTRAGIVSPAGTDRWYVSLSGGPDDPPPRSWAEMGAYAETLEASWIALLLDRGEPLGDPRLFRRPLSIWHRYDLQKKPTVGLLPVGDAYMCLDPLSGQGMSVAAWHASILAESLGERDGRSWREELANAYLPRAAKACRAAWTLGEVLVGGRSIAGTQGLGALLEGDPDLHRRYVGAWHLTEPAAAIDAAFSAASA